MGRDALEVLSVYPSTAMREPRQEMHNIVGMFGIYILNIWKIFDFQTNLKFELVIFQ